MEGQHALELSPERAGVGSLGKQARDARGDSCARDGLGERMKDDPLPDRSAREAHALLEGVDAADIVLDRFEAEADPIDVGSPEEVTSRGEEERVVRIVPESLV